VPYKNPDQRRAYDRERRRFARAGVSNPSPTRVPPEIRIRVMADVLGLLERAVQLAELDEMARPLEQARALGFLAGVAVRAVEAADLAGRVEALEAALKLRKTA
jgi:hypothetical protein